jgi:hypothetical protein
LSRDDLAFPLKNRVVRELMFERVRSVLSECGVSVNPLALDNAVKVVLSIVRRLAPDAELEQVADLWLLKALEEKSVQCFKHFGLTPDCKSMFKQVARVIALYAKHYSTINAVAEAFAKLIEKPGTEVLEEVCKAFGAASMEAQEICLAALSKVKSSINTAVAKSMEL